MPGDRLQGPAASCAACQYERCGPIVVPSTLTTIVQQAPLRCTARTRVLANTGSETRSAAHPGGTTRQMPAATAYIHRPLQRKGLQVPFATLHVTRPCSCLITLRADAGPPAGPVPGRAPPPRRHAITQEHASAREGTTPMHNQKALRGLALIAAATFFAVQAATYPVGSFANAGAGLFPLLVSGLLGLIGLVMLVQSRFEPAVAMHFNARNVAIILAGLMAFVLIARHLNVLLAIVGLVFIATLAGTEWSLARNLKISVVLIGIAYAFHALLGLNLPLL